MYRLLLMVLVFSHYHMLSKWHTMGSLYFALAWGALALLVGTVSGIVD